jgi:hypothetical protein
MTPIQRKIHRTFLIPALLLAGCAPTKPPNIGLEDSARALDAARAAGASTYSPLELRNAEDHLSQARATAGKGDYEAAQRLAQESTIDSELATVKARLGKAREKADARTRENDQLRQDLSNGAAATPAGAQP